MNRFNNAGEQIDSVIIVNDVEPITTQYYPDISVNEQGNCIVTWYDYRNKNGVYFQQYKNIGSSDLFEKVDSNKSVADYIIQINHPRVSICNSSEFAISWSEFNGAYNDLKFRVYEETGTPLTEILYVTESQERDQINQDIIFADDKIYNVWQDNHELGVGYDIWANVYSMSELVTDIEENNLSLPNEFTLEQNYPNPFNPSTTIKYTIPNIANTKFASSTNVELKIYDILGREIKTLVNENQKPGSYEIKFDASNLSSGIYFYSLNAGEFHQVNKMMLLK
ncbi:MAG: T9SS type A sorting domain-containing protein [Ignavibacteriae bacterium]|nr:T9SS type A sorting domain-containing protein [Ignavibacteriota bacterium]